MSLMLSSSVLNRPAVILPIALSLLAAAGGVMWTNVTRHEETRFSGAAHSSPTAPVTTAVLVSSADIPRGQLLSAQDFSIKLLAPAQIPSASLRRAADAEGHMAMKSIKSGTPLLKDDVSDQAVEGLSVRIPESFRAYAVPVSEANIAGGFIQAGDHVDLYVTLPGALFTETTGKRLDDRSTAALLLQSVEVLAVGTKLKSDGSPNPSIRTVTLAVSTADLARLALATRLGTISFAIRNPVDEGQQPASRAELASLVGDVPTSSSAKRGTPAHGAPTRSVPLYAGRDRTLLQLP